MTPPDAIAGLLAVDIASITQQLITSGNVARWERSMREAITRGHTAAAIAGIADRLGVEAGSQLLNSRNLSRAETRDIRAQVSDQMPYLRQFAAEVAAGQLSDAQIAARAALYAGATRATFFKARWRGLPGYPADGNTACLVNCKCSWVERDGLMYWELGTAEHCPDCLSRAAQWSPWVPE